MDESGFYLLPCCVRTYAPKGQTPVLRHKLSKEHLSVISGITAEGKLFTMLQDNSFNSEAVIAFLLHLLSHIQGRIVIVWDGAPIHKSKAIKAFLASAEGKRIHLEMLPGYAPDLNPDEGVWGYLKYKELKNVSCENLAQLRYEFVKARERLRHKKHIIKACFRHAGYD